MTGTPGRRFEDAIVLVTGGGSGIGAAVVRQFDREGCAAIYVADVDSEGAKTVAAGTRSGRAVTVDVTVALTWTRRSTGSSRNTDGSMSW